MKTYRETGNMIAYTNATGDLIPVDSVVVIGSMLAVAAVDIPDGETGECVVEGVHKLPKAAGTAFLAGDQLIWDVSAGEFIAADAVAATGDITGAAICWAPAAAAATVCLVKLNPALGAVTA